MARAPMLSVRVDPGRLAWLQGYAAARGTSRSAVVNAALREFEALARAGVPDLAEEMPARDGRSSAARQGKVAGSGGPSSPGSASPAVSRPAAGDAPEPLIYVVARVERERFGPDRGGAPVELLKASRRIKLGRVQVAGEVVRDPEALVDPSEVAL